MEEDKKEIFNDVDTPYVQAKAVDGESLTHRRRGRFQVAHNPSSFAPGLWSNKDMDPSPPKDRTWSTFDFSCYWLSDSCAIATWELGSSMVAGGLSWKLAILAVAMGQLIANICIAFNGTIGARVHAPSPVLFRASHGFSFAYWAIISRNITGWFWLGITAVSGGACVEQLLFAMSPSFRNYPNHISPKIGVTSSGMIAYLVYFLLQFPLLLVPWPKIMPIFKAKAVVGFAVFLAIMGSTVVKNGGGVTSPGSFISTGSTISGSTQVWTFFSSMNSVIGAYSTFAVNVSDFSRFSKSRNSQWIQIFWSPFGMVVIATLGVMAAAASDGAYGSTLWAPTAIINEWTSPGGRAGAAFCSMGLIFVQLGINISANSIAAGNDFAALCPKYIDVRRGQILAAFVGCWILCPWIVLSQASNFLSFVGGYSIFLGPIAAIMATDFWVVKRQKFNVPELYRPNGIYSYGNRFRTNWRALAACVIGAVPGFPGWVSSIGSPNVPIAAGWVHISDLAWIYSFALAAVVYVSTSLIWPAHGTLLAEHISGEETIEQFDIEEKI